MKTKRIFVAAATLGIMSFVTSCSNEALDSASDTVMLEAEVSGIANTRAAIEGTTLPEGSEYGLYVFQDYKAVSGNIKMNANSTSTGYLLTNNSEVKVCAYYPYSELGLEGEDMVTIYPGTTDYLHTISSETYTKSNPKAKIEMHHALARVKFNVTVAADATDSYEVYFTELDNVYTKGSMRIGFYDGEVYGSYKSNGRVNIEPIKDYLKAGVAVSSEVLLLPQDLKYEAPKVLLDINGESKDISADLIKATASGKWESGKIYTYNITINEGARLSVTSATIEEWGEATDLDAVVGNETKPDPVENEIVTFTVNGVSFNMVKVEAGTFLMGKSTDGDDVKPVHEVTLTKDFYIGETEVTQALWKAVTGYTPTSNGNSWSSDKGKGDDYPAYYISYDDVKSFINKLNTLTGKEFRMPTEAEWEFAAKGGNKSKGYTYSGSDFAKEVAWVGYGDIPHPIKTKLPNELGIYDMSGNVYEWCYDWYGEYPSEPQIDPTGSTFEWHRVYRGGSVGSGLNKCYTWTRDESTPSYQRDNVGVRIAIDK